MLNAIVRLARRHVRGRSHGVNFVGMSRTRLPDHLTFGGQRARFSAPEEGLLVADFANVVLDDDYGLRSLRPFPETVVDVGTNVGFFAKFARHCFPDAIIHGYEPSPQTAEYARSNLEHPRTTLFVEGVAAETGRAELEEHGSSNLTRTLASDAGAIILTSFATVVERIGGRIDLLKVDCEGAEWDFMRDRDTFARVGKIRMEYHLVEGRSLDDLHRLAANIGFTVTRLVENDGFGIAWLDPIADNGS